MERMQFHFLILSISCSVPACMPLEVNFGKNGYLQIMPVHKEDVFLGTCDMKLGICAKVIEVHQNANA